LFIIATLFYREERSAELRLIGQEEYSKLNLYERTIYSDIKSSFSSLTYLSEEHELSQFVETGNRRHLDLLAKGYLTFCTKTGLYDQLR
jgi:hypothetical protein